MSPQRFAEFSGRYPQLRLAVVGDFCLDRYLEIDPARAETSIETGLPVHNVVRVRSQPGAAGTIVNNLVALGIGHIDLIGFCGEDGEGFELLRALRALPGVELEYFAQTPTRATFTYTKPLVMEPGEAPQELSRLDIKNWSPTPAALSTQVAVHLRETASVVDGLIIMDQVSVAETGVITSPVLAALAGIAKSHPELPIVADSRRSLREYPVVTLKMNAHELAALAGTVAADPGFAAMKLARAHGSPVIVTLAERGLVGARPDEEEPVKIPAWPVRGEIDVVGAGDAVTANITAALAAGASFAEGLACGNAAASIVIHQIGTTGTATREQLSALLATSRASA